MVLVVSVMIGRVLWLLLRVWICWVVFRLFMIGMCIFIRMRLNVLFMMVFMFCLLLCVLVMVVFSGLRKVLVIL